MQHQSLFIFDIETIPDTQAAKNLTGLETDNIQELRQALTDYHLEVTDGKNAFLRQPFHKVVAISFLEADIHRNEQGEYYTLKSLRSGGNEDASEKQLLQGFFSHLSKSRPRFVSFNGRTFDFPVLKYRAMLHGISAPWFYQSGDKWNNYTQRYSIDWHCDLLEALSDFGASARVRLNEVCSLLGLPGKLGTDGSMVSDLYDAGKIKEIRDYCELDVLNTYLVYLRYMQHRGDLTTHHYESAIEDVRIMLEKEQAQRSHFGEFLGAWEKAQAVVLV